MKTQRYMDFLSLYKEVEHDKDIEWEGSFSLSFPPDDIEIKTPSIADSRSKFIVHFLSIGGAFGPLAMPFTQRVMNRVRKKDRGMLAFFNLFNQRLLEIFYKLRTIYTPGQKEPLTQADSYAEMLKQLVGIGFPALRNRFHFHENEIMGNYAPFASVQKTSANLKLILEQCFKVQVEIREHLGQWIEIPLRQQTRLDKKGRNNTLGSTTVLGKKAWVPQSRFQVVFLNMTREKYLSFLPSGKHFAKLKDLIQFYLPNAEELDYQLELQIKPTEIPLSSLNTTPENAMRLGYNSWLKSGTEIQAENSERPSSAMVTKMDYDA